MEKSISNSHNRVTLFLLILVFMVAVIVRVCYLVNFGGLEDYVPWAFSHYFGGISAGYYKMGIHLFTNPRYLDSGHPPGYMIFIGLLKLLGVTNIQYMRFVQSIIDSSCVIFIYYIFNYLKVSRFYAIIGSFVYAIYPLWAFGAVMFLAEWISPFTMIVTIFLLLRQFRNQIDSSNYLNSIFLGLTIGFGALSRPDLIILIIIALLINMYCYLRISIKKIAITSLLIFLPFLLIIGSWGAYNKHKIDHWVFTSTSSGAGLWEGLGDMANPYGYILSDKHAQDYLKEKGLVFGTYEGNQYLKSEYFSRIEQHPVYFLKVILHRWNQILFYSIEPAQVFSLKDKRWLYLPFLLLLIATISFRKNKKILLVMWLPMIYALFSIGLVHYEARYVRYASLSYLFSLVVLMNAFYLLFYKRKYIGIRLIGLIPGLLLLVVAFLSFASLTSVTYMNVSSYQGVQKIKSMLANNDKLLDNPYVSLNKIQFIPFSRKEGSLERQPKSIKIITSKNGGGFQYYFPLNLHSNYNYVITFQVKLVSGVASFGVYNEKKHVWNNLLVMRNPGEMYKETFIIPSVVINNTDKLSIIIANSTGKQERSILEIYNLSIYRIDK